MKKLTLTLLLSAALFAATIHTAKVLETMNSGGYTYIKVQDGNQNYWIAMTQRSVKTGDTIKYTEQGWMKNFHSKTLNRTFDKILFAADIAKQQKNPAEKKPNIMNSKYQEKGTVSIAGLFKERTQYAQTKVTVKGKVTKVSSGIMGLNWIHIQDGSRFEGMDDLVFTTKQNPPKIGMIVYAKGIAIKDKDFGYGYFYPLIIQEATFSSKN
ncbi:MULTISPECIES: GW dipeptide domain-containing protein [Sulfurimonas]|uniref:GW dipeptide domain-containing protein n=1 Tax=Sulfurimonas TaxID=202746 RepID=UPI001263EDDD|nr:GW dipeptide domain-containing protein [Sulfurimonas indica]